MLLGLLGDIHGNDLALEAVLTAAGKEGVQELLITGDLVGYYFAPQRIMAMLRPWKSRIVRGNHEDMLKRVREDPSLLAPLEARYGSGLRIARDALDPTDADMLCNLPHPDEIKIDSRRILLCHGAPWDNDEYIYPDASETTLRRCCESGHDIVVLGQTHYPMVKRIGSTVIVNPGSVGQPRDRNPGAAWAILDTERLQVVLRREPYDVDAVAAEAARRNPDLPYLVSVLKRT
jgi:putative phosphoesterase